MTASNWGFVGVCPPVDWELIKLFGVVAMPNFLGWWDFYFRGCCRNVHVDDNGGGSWSTADEATDADGRNGASAAKFLAAVDKFCPTVVVGHNNDAVGVLREGIDLVIFLFVIAEGFEEGAEVPVCCVVCICCAEVPLPAVVEDHHAC